MNKHYPAGGGRGHQTGRGVLVPWVEWCESSCAEACGRGRDSVWVVESGVRHLPSGTVTMLFTDVEGSTSLLDGAPRSRAIRQRIDGAS